MRQRALAEQVGLSPSQLSRTESGKKPPPPADTVLRMIAVLRLSTAEAGKLLAAAGYPPQLLEADEIDSRLSDPSAQQILTLVDHATRALETASHDLRTARELLTRRSGAERD